MPLEAVRIKGRPIRALETRVDKPNGGVSLAKVQDLDAQIDPRSPGLLGGGSKGLGFHNDWKVLTIMIGANNLSCEQGRKGATFEFFEAKYRVVLERARIEIPKFFVNAVPMFNISGVYAQQQTSDYCKLIKPVSNNECPCMGREGRDRAAMDEHNALYTRSIYNISSEYIHIIRREELLGLRRGGSALLPRSSRACAGVPERRGLFPPIAEPKLTMNAATWRTPQHRAGEQHDAARGRQRHDAGPCHCAHCVPCR
jgi:hypothetical protein